MTAGIQRPLAPFGRGAGALGRGALSATTTDKPNAADAAKNHSLKLAAKLRKTANS
jgi:hypothetical protein